MFSNFVSLGAYCAVAASMSKFGLRSWSGPFDWLVTNSFKWVLYFVENDFEGFLERNDLERWENNPRAFKNKKSDFRFFHDKEFLFEEQYDGLRQKYMRRIDRFLGETEKPTCYIRWVTSDNEIEYINKHYDYINKVIKKRNNKSDILFVVKNDLKLSETLLFKKYIMPESRYGMAWERTRGLFNGAHEFLANCAMNYNSKSMMDNLVFDRKQEDKIYEQRTLELEKCRTALKRNDEIAKQRYLLFRNLLEKQINFTLLPQKIIIYGAGNVGRLFYNKVKAKCKVICFVDRKEAGNNIDGILVKKLEEIHYEENLSFVITPAYDTEKIIKDINDEAKGKCNNIRIILLKNIFTYDCRGEVYE